METRKIKISELRKYHKNARRGNIDAIAESLQVNGQYKPILVNIGTSTGRPLEVLVGNNTVEAASLIGLDELDAVMIDADDEQARRIVLADNRTSDLATYDDELLAELLAEPGGLEGTGFTDVDIDALLAEDEPKAETPTLSERFLAPPLSVINRRVAEWQERKREWLALGIDSGAGRPDATVRSSGQSQYRNWYEVKNRLQSAAGRELSDAEVIEGGSDDLQSIDAGTSLFDPALAEIIVRWFSAEGARVVDPWSGGSVRGIVAGALGREYVGIDISAPQIEANRAQAHIAASARIGGVEPSWIVADCVAGLDAMDAESADLIYSCPPYYDLEVYSDDDGDMSQMSHVEFEAHLSAAIVAAERVMKPDSFFVLVIGSARRRDGSLSDMRRAVLNGAITAGLSFVQDAIILDPVASAATRAARMFSATRALARVHQEMIVLVKGSRKGAAERAGVAEVAPLADD